MIAWLIALVIIFGPFVYWIALRLIVQYCIFRSPFVEMAEYYHHLIFHQAGYLDDFDFISKSYFDTDYWYHLITPIFSHILIFTFTLKTFELYLTFGRAKKEFIKGNIDFRGRADYKTLSEIISEKMEFAKSEKNMNLIRKKQLKLKVEQERYSITK